MNALNKFVLKDDRQVMSLTVSKRGNAGRNQTHIIVATA